MNAIDALFQRLRTRQQQAFIPFIPAGDPDLAATPRLVEEVVRRGANLIEIGFPYSDPIADGSVIQAAYTRALSKGIHIADILAMIRQLADHPLVQAQGVPLVGMVSYTLVYRRSPKTFVEQAYAAGLSGLIVPDLPWDEATELAKLAAERDLKLIQLVTPTTPRDRAIQIAKAATGFLYCVSVLGITGERDRLPDELVQQLAWLRQQTALPLCVGFGISKPEHIQMLRNVADGIIVGSALVRRLEKVGTQSLEQIIREVGELVASLVHACQAK